jgi:hypothetical protein
MHGPYTVQIRRPRSDEVIVELGDDELREGSRIAERFYQDATPALAEGALRSGVFAAAGLLVPGEEVGVQVIGFTGSGRTEVATEWKGASVRRDDRGRLVSSLGSRFNERVFRGV